MILKVIQCFNQSINTLQRFVIVFIFLSGNLKDSLVKQLNPSATSGYGLVPSLSYLGVKPRIQFDGQCLKQDKVKFPHKNVINLYIACEIDLWSYTQCVGFTLENFLFWAVQLTKNTDFGKYKYYRCGIGFDARRRFSLSRGSEFGKNVIIFGAYICSSVFVDNKKLYILIPSKGPTQGLDDATWNTEKEYFMNLTEQRK